MRPLILLDKTQGRQFVLFSFEEYFVLGVLWLWLQRNDCPIQSRFLWGLDLWLNVLIKSKMKSRSVHCITVWRQYLKLAAKFNISWSILFTFYSRIRNLLEVRFTLASQAGKTRCTLWIRSSENSKLMFEYEGPFTGVICLLIACSFFVWCVWLAIRSLTRN